MTTKYVSENEFDEFLKDNPLAIPNGFKLVGSMEQTKWAVNGEVVAVQSRDGFGFLYEIKFDN